jgi:hypothetical protein
VESRVSEARPGHPANEANSLEYAAKCAEAARQARAFCYRRWIRSISYVKRKSAEYKTERQKETPQDRYSRRTAHATIAMAGFTFVLVGVGYIQYLEIRGAGIESSEQTNQLIHEYRSQVAQLRRQAGDTHDLAVAAGKQADKTQDLADQMKDQADQTKRIASQAIVQANAAKSAAVTADKALHISERAYIVAGQPTIDAGTKYISLPIVNSGHIPSGKIRAIIHEVTLDGTDPAAVRPTQILPTEAHWRHHEMESIPPTSNQTRTFTVFVPARNVDYLNSGREQVFVVGVVTYSDGFPDDTEQQWPFCYGNAMLSQSKAMTWAVCDSNFYLPQAIQADHYPNNEADH